MSNDNFISTRNFIPTVQEFTVSGTYTKPPGLKSAIVQVQGGGGVGGFASANATDTASYLGSGAGAGGYTSCHLVESLIGATESVSVGVGGVTSGTGGGTSQFGATPLVRAAGGSAGATQSISLMPYATGGNGGSLFTVSGFELVRERGHYGGNSWTKWDQPNKKVIAFRGAGGKGFIGRGSSQGHWGNFGLNLAGTAGEVGGGGCGAVNLRADGTASGSSMSGGAGGNGLVRVLSYT